MSLVQLCTHCLREFTEVVLDMADSFHFQPHELTGTVTHVDEVYLNVVEDFLGNNGLYSVPIPDSSTEELSSLLHTDHVGLTVLHKLDSL